MTSPSSSQNSNESKNCSLYLPSALLHTIGIISFFLSFRFLISHPTVINEAYGSHWQFLTVLGLTASYAAFIFGLLADITRYAPFVFLHRKLVLCSAPLEVVVSIIYWSLHIIDPSLLVSADIHLELHVDLGLHAAPAILLALDFFLFSPSWNISVLQASGLSSIVTASYWAWVEHCFSRNKIYPYPLFGKLDTFQRAILFCLAAVLMTGSSLLLQGLHGKFRSTSRQDKAKVS